MTMTATKSLPFEEGQLAEAKSFEKGYLGAWFRCKIQKMITRKEILCLLEYYDYIDEEIKWTQIHQTPPKRLRRRLGVKKELMLRPPFPQICLENEMPDINSISEVKVVIDGVWRVGDLVDWWFDNCYWSGTVTETEGDDKVKITLRAPPYGEGSSYSVCCKDLRPSLDWSPEYGWTVPRSPEIQNDQSCPRLIQPVRQDNEKQSMQTTSSLEFNESMSSHTSAISLPPSKNSMKSNDLMKQTEDDSKIETLQRHGISTDLGVGDSVLGKPTCSDSVSSSYVRDVSTEVPAAASAEERYHDNSSLKKMPVNETIPLNSTASGSLESTIMDLEELVNRVKWLRGLLKLGVPTKTLQPTWKFLESPAVSTSK